MRLDGAGWDYGTNLTYLKALVDYWQHHFDWQAQEATLNHFAQFRAQIDGFGVHFIHERGKGPNPLPIIITHGWPDSFYRMHKIIPRLSDPASFGGDPFDSFDVVVPSLPGYGFSDRPHQRGMTPKRTAELWAQLMRDMLGYRRFAAAGGDIGSGVTRLLALTHPDLLIGIHLTDVGLPTFTPDPSELTFAEKQYLDTVQQWRTAGKRLCNDACDQTANPGLRVERLSRWVSRLDGGEVPCVERLPGRRGNAIQQRRAAHQHHDLLGERDHQFLDAYVL